MACDQAVLASPELSYDAELQRLAARVSKAYTEAARRTGMLTRFAPVEADVFLDLLERGVIEAGPGLFA